MPAAAGNFGSLGGQKRIVSTPVRNYCGFNSSRANATRTFGFCTVASSFKFRHNARLECTAMSGDHLVEDGESPLPRIRKVAPALD